jgi:hypothetical protein
LTPSFGVFHHLLAEADVMRLRNIEYPLS